MRDMYSWCLAAVLVSSASAVPPDMTLPPHEAVLPGTAAEAKAERVLGYGPKLLRVPDAWTKSPAARGAGVRVAVLDTGVDASHPWIKPRLRGTYNAITKREGLTDGNGHGTHCCGIVLEALPECDLYAVKVLSDQGSGSVVDIAHAIDYAVTVLKVDVISMSLGGPQADEYLPPAIKRANDAGVLVIAAAGNDGPGENTDGYPARYPGVLAVAACDDQRKVARFSSRGRSVFVLTPGVSIVSALPGGRQGAMSGTSMACPYAAALAGSWCATANVPKLERPAAFAQALRAACDHPTDRTTAEGYGLPNAEKLVTAGTTPTPTPGPVPFSITVTLADLTAGKRTELLAAGVETFTLSIDGKRQPMPPSSSTPPSSSKTLDAAELLAVWSTGKPIVIAVGVPARPGELAADPLPGVLEAGRRYQLWTAGGSRQYAALDQYTPADLAALVNSTPPPPSCSTPPPPAAARPGLGSYSGSTPTPYQLFRPCPNCR